MEDGTSTRRVVGGVLAAGVWGSVALMLAGAVVASISPSSAPVPATVKGLLRGAASGHGPAIMQLGVALLIATPVLRVLASVLSFARQRDWTYVAITTTVLALLALGILLPGLLGQG